MENKKRMTVSQINNAMCYGEIIQIHFDGEEVLEFEAGDFLLQCFSDYLVESISIVGSEDGMASALRLNILVQHRPVKAGEEDLTCST